jgi:RecJ-like exonuclease
MQPLRQLAKKAADRIRAEDGIIHIVAHYDADGLSSAAILAAALIKLDKAFHLMIAKRISQELLSRLRACRPCLVIFADLGSGYLSLIEKLKTDVIIADHHEIEHPWTGQGLIHINPELFGIKGLSGAYVNHLIASSLGSKEPQLALVGSIGDSQLNAVPELLENGGIRREPGLKLFGRYSRPLHKTLELSTDPWIPGISGNESAAIQFLAEIGIPAFVNGRWRTLADLSASERQKLIDAIIRERLPEMDTANIFGDVWTLEGWQDELADAREFALLLNACGRQGEAAVGVAMCLRSKKALHRARELLLEYRKAISAALNWIKGSKLRNGAAVYILAGSAISESIIGPVVSIYSKSSDKPVIGMAAAEDGIKVSARARGININKIVRIAAAEAGGTSGGHREAAGATIPAASEELFIRACERLLRKSL